MQYKFEFIPLHVAFHALRTNPVDQPSSHFGQPKSQYPSNHHCISEGRIDQIAKARFFKPLGKLLPLRISA